MSSAAPPCGNYSGPSRKRFRDRAKTARLPAGTTVRDQPGILFAFIPESFSRSPRNPVRLAPESPGYRTNLADFVCQATGGPCEYKGLDLHTTHQGLHITRQAFQSVVEDLTATLDSLKVPEAEKNELLGMLAPLESQIVER
jgi:hypothetical protein